MGVAHGVHLCFTATVRNGGFIAHGDRKVPCPKNPGGEMVPKNCGGREREIQGVTVDPRGENGRTVVELGQFYERRDTRLRHG